VELPIDTHSSSLRWSLTYNDVRFRVLFERLFEAPEFDDYSLAALSIF